MVLSYDTPVESRSNRLLKYDLSRLYLIFCAIARNGRHKNMAVVINVEVARRCVYFVHKKGG